MLTEEQPAEACVARIVLLSAEGVGTTAIQRQTGKDKPTIWRWQRYAANPP
jgi:hypothetical protein